MLLRESLEEIDDFRVKRCSKFEFGPPSADTILRVFRNVNADKIEKVFICVCPDSLKMQFYNKI